MKLVYQLPRNSLAWLLVAQAAAIAPHIPRLPVWLVGAWLFVVAWRVQVFRGVWAFPGAPVKALLVIVCGASLLFGYGRFFGLEPMVALLLAAFVLKLLEMHRRRDALVVIYLGFFTCSTQLLFSTTMPAAVYALLCVVLLTAALIGLNQSEGHKQPLRSVQLAAKLVLQCLPMMVLLFLVLPRLGALWSVPMQQSAASTGVSDSMSPGDITRLARSGGLAFRVAFDGAVPPPSQRYWRGLVFSRFDGRRWSQARIAGFRDGPVLATPDNPQPWQRLVEVSGSSRTYEVIMEPSHQPWLFALATPRDYSTGISLTRDFRLVYREPVGKRLRYRVTSYPDYRLEAQPLPDWRLRQELQLPDDFNPRARRQAQEWYRDAGSTEAYVERLLDYYNSDFTYTLEPPPLGRDSVDEFLWGTKRGFCEHFAGSFVFMLRAAGVPARVVVGYLGGELNPLEGYLQVRQYDAHAWAEVWLRGRGWVRVDPTGAVAPERIEADLRSALSEQESQLVSGVLALDRYRAIAWLNRLRLQWDALNYRWHRRVLGYDSTMQAGLLRQLLGEVSPLRVALLVIGVGGAILGLIALRVLLKGRKPRPSPATRQYQRFVRKLSRAGLARAPGEPPRDFARRVATRRPDLEQAVLAITDLYERISYAGQAALVPELRRSVARFTATRNLFR
ncbi:DUF3488 domain-containing protein [Exilibacterium tricleocarpae]|uniref:DUF3488 domain-containing protein n=1 Tax=Exilibacterium tricleocarpae TaxID=2591008 RepID=A0A545SRW3_9GAMM|nr:DUF3488 and transglutaminase-like domain-containing protein [Exilibacterium tricleocarpae]TQV67702.1 DUF3488 domain-containing protein [Exilibacterium tricleocarpae]